MIWNAPIWLNTALVDIIKFMVGFSIFLFFLIPCLMISRLYSMIKLKEKFSDYIKDQTHVVLLGALIAGVVIVSLFYLPQEVLPDTYQFDSISIRFMDESITKQTLELNRKDQIDRFRKLFDGYKCRRSFDSGSTSVDSEVAFIDIFAVKNNRAFPLHFIIKEDNLRRYTAGNVDFIYEVEDRDLTGKVFEFIRECGND